MSDQENTAPTAPETTPIETPSKPDPIVFLEEDEDLDSHYEKSLQGFQEEEIVTGKVTEITDDFVTCLLYTSPSPRDGLLSRMPSSA